jgi:hypothetical protein
VKPDPWDNIPRSSFQNPVPVPDQDPAAGTLISVCFNAAWLPYIIGSLKQLLQDTTWDTADPSVLALAIEQSTNLIGLFQEGLCTVTTGTILRADPTGCGIQWSTDDGSTWNTIELSACIADLVGLGISNSIDQGIIQGGTSETAPQSPPIASQCATYHVHLNANSAWVCPSPINTDDTVTITNARGATNDGSGLGALGPWFCPDGKSYGLGTCGGTGSTSGTDPLPTSFHMIPVGFVGSAWFDPTSTYLVPSGVTNAQLNIQVNDLTLGDNLGSYDFDVTICSAGWHHFLDFTASDQGFSARSGLSTYVAAQGWTQVGAGSGVANDIQKNWTGSTHFQRVIGKYEASGVDGSSGIGVGTLSVNFVAGTVADGSQTLDSGLISEDASQLLMSGSSAGGGAVIVWKSLEVWGSGVDPF